MFQKFVRLFFVITVVAGIINFSAVYAAEWVTVSGDVTTADGTLLCAMVLANGQHMFTCDPIGKYSLYVPLDDNEQITLFGFCEGLMPFKIVLNKWQTNYNIQMSPCSSGEPSSPSGTTETEPNDTQEKANSIGIGYTNAIIEARIASNDDVDFYKFTTSANRTYVIQTFDILRNSSNDATGLWLYDSEGNLLDDDDYGQNGNYDTDASITYTFLKAGTYYVKVKNRNWTGEYSLRILSKHDEPGANWGLDNEPNGKMAVANYIGVGLDQAQTHQLADDASYVSNGSDYDWYYFNAEAGNTYIIETFDISANTSNSATGLWLYDSEGNIIDDDDYGQNGTNDADASISHTFLKAGTYYVLVNSYYSNKWTGMYSLRVLSKHDEPKASWGLDNEPNDRLALANYIGLGLEESQTHQIKDNTSYVSNGSDRDWYHFDAEAGHTYVMETFNVQKSSSKGTGIWLYDSYGNVLANDGYGQNGTNDANASISYSFIMSDTYYIMVTNGSYEDWAGSYSLRICDEDSCQ